MLARHHRTRRSPACNDNGAFARPRTAPPQSILKIAAEVCGSISLSYVADGVTVIARGEQGGSRRAA